MARVDKRIDETLSNIEQTQAELRESIRTAKRLAEQSDRLIKQHRKEIAEDRR